MMRRVGGGSSVHGCGLTVGYNDRFLDIRACIISGSFNADANMSQLLTELVAAFPMQAWHGNA